MEEYKYGEVDCQGQRYTLTQRAYISESGAYYEATAVHDGEIYRVRWANLARDHIVDIDGLCKVCRNSNCEYGEEDSCADWGYPSEVTKIG